MLTGSSGVEHSIQEVDKEHLESADGGGSKRYREVLMISTFRNLSEVFSQLEPCPRILKVLSYHNTYGRETLTVCERLEILEQR